MNIILIGI